MIRIVAIARSAWSAPLADPLADISRCTSHALKDLGHAVSLADELHARIDQPQDKPRQERQ
ncbi:MAG: hypothetical protein RQ826_01015 [Xanthomonadales bacterium]|nr:hypothetical protein [Xanthomonadales bacterium]